MRIIGGLHKGRLIKVPKDLPVRPTTDFAKEALFNILTNRFEIDKLSVLDLFSGTGHISLEFSSRGAQQVTAVDQNFKCIGFLRSIAKELDFDIQISKNDVFDFLKKTQSTYDLIFSDPPYDLLNIPLIHELVFKRGLLKDGGSLIIEHGPKTHLGELAGFKEQRKYGGVNFSIFEKHTA